MKNGISDEGLLDRTLLTSMIRRRRKHRFVTQMATTSPRGLFPIFLWTNRAKPLIITAKMWRQPACPIRIFKVMRSVSILAPVLAAAALSACVSATSVPSFEAVEQSYTPLAESAAAIAGSGNTLYANLPDGTGVYSGLILGDDLCHAGNDLANCAGPAVEYLAKLTLNANYDNQEVTGSLSEFVTKLANFKNPAGAIELTGAICDNGSLGSAACDGSEPDGLAYIAFEGSGELIGANGNKALYWFKAGSPSGADLGADGAFGGDTGQVIAGNFGSDFQWLEGIYIGISGSDGNWVVMLQ